MNNLAPITNCPGRQGRSKSSQTKSVSVEKSYEKAFITVTSVFENMFPDDISTPHTET